MFFHRTKLGSGHTYTDAVVLAKRYTGSKSLENRIVHAVVPSSLLLPESIQVLKSFYGKSGYSRKSLQLMKSDVYQDVINQYQLDVSSNHIKLMAEKFTKMSKL